MRYEPALLRAIFKRFVAWDTGRPAWWQRSLRAHFMRDLDPAMRYGPAISPARAAARVLEVGSGPYGMAPFARRRIVGVDQSFRGPRDDRLLPVTADASRLPFADDTFDLVLCFDVLEHVPRHGRSKVLAELARVCSRRLIVAVPFGNGARSADREAAEWHERVSTTPHHWLAEHLQHGIPGPEDLDGFEAAVGHPASRRIAYTPLWLWRLARREEIFLRPHLTLLRRVACPFFASHLWRIPGRGGYRLLMEFELEPAAARE